MQAGKGHAVVSKSGGFYQREHLPLCAQHERRCSRLRQRSTQPGAAPQENALPSVGEARLPFRKLREAYGRRVWNPRATVRVKCEWVWKDTTRVTGVLRAGARAGSSGILGM